MSFIKVIHPFCPVICVRIRTETCLTVVELWMVFFRMFVAKIIYFISVYMCILFVRKAESVPNALLRPDFCKAAISQTLRPPIALGIDQMITDTFFRAANYSSAKAFTCSTIAGPGVVHVLVV